MVMCMLIISVSQSLKLTNGSQICEHSRQSWKPQDAQLQVVCVYSLLTSGECRLKFDLAWRISGEGSATSVERVETGYNAVHTPGQSNNSIVQGRIVRSSNNLGALAARSHRFRK